MNQFAIASNHRYRHDSVLGARRPGLGWIRGGPNGPRPCIGTWVAHAH